MVVINQLTHLVSCFTTSSGLNCLKIKQVINLLPKTYHLQKTVINSKFIIYIITTLLIWLQRY